MNAGLDILCHRLLSALVNGGYQGLGITAVVWFGLKVFPRVNAATRHMVLLITLLLVVALPVAHYFLPNRGGTEPLVNLSAVDSPAEAQALKAGAPSVTAESRHAWSQENLGPPLIKEAPRVEAEVFFSDNSALTRPDLESPSLRFRNDTEPEVPQAAELVGRTAAEFSTASDPGQDRGAAFLRWLTSGSRNWQFSLPDHVGTVLVALWCLLTFLRLGLLAWQCRWLHFLKRRSLPASDALNRQFRTLAEEMRLKRKPRLLMCPENTAPMAVGFWDPAVLLPAKAFEDVPDLQLGHVLRHELAHVRRHDDWANLVQQTVKAVLFFHPAVHWLSRRLTVEREIACDDHVLAATHTPRSYALFLTEFAGRRQGHVVVAAPAAWSSQNQLTERINMILDVNRNSSPSLARLRLGILTAGAIWIAVLGLTTGPRLVFAQENANNNLSVDQTAEVPTQVAVELIEDSAQPPATTESVPRQKPRRAQQVAPAVAPAPDPQPIEVPRPRFRSRAPAMVAPPTAPGHPTPYAIAAALPADAQPATPSKPPAASAPRLNASDDSLERRLERLEQMVQSLMAREQIKKRTDAGHDFHFDLKGPMFDQALEKEIQAKIAAAHVKAARKLPKFEYQEEELDRNMEKANRDVERAERDAQRAAKDLERAALEKQRPEADERAAAVQAQTWQSAKIQLKALEAQRKALEKQMQAVERQLQRLKEDQDENQSNQDEQEDKVKDKVKDKAKRLEKDRDSVNSDDFNELEKP
jgi:beta-lactamase regulating signal transducer with metallopeptidase domain